MANVFEQLQSGRSYDILQEDYQKEVHCEISRCDHICWELRMTDPDDRGRNVYINHNLTMMSLGGITIDDGVMIGPGTSLLTVNHEPGNIRVVMTKPIHIKKNAWIGGSVRILPGVTIGENAIVGTGAVVTRDVPDNAVAAGVPARVLKMIEIPI